MNASDNPQSSAGPKSPVPAGGGRSIVWLGWALFLVAAVATLLLGLLAVSILQRREEAKARPPLVELAQFEADSSRWGENYPRQYDRYRLLDKDTTTRTRYGGAFPRDYLEETPANVVLFAGYAFAKEYRQARGHTWAIRDVTETKRVNEKTPGTCWTCKSPDVPRLMAQMGSGDVMAGAGKFYASNFNALKAQITHPIGCADCHEPNTMRLRITRPALREAFQRRHLDIDQVSHQEMRSLVCAQCHVEYYFKGEGKYLTFPWDQGMTPDEVEKHYDEAKFSDWTHAVSQAPMVKIQHPDYEVYSTGIHAYRNVSCADCHMPYRTEGGVKITDHLVQSPLLNVANSCAVCHRWGEAEIRTRVEAIQDRVREGRDRAEKALAMAHFDIAAAGQAGAKDGELAGVRSLVRGAQLRWDFVAANNGMGFHSPQLCEQTLAAAIDLAGQCRVECARILARHGFTDPVHYPDFGTKEKAQALEQAIAAKRPPDLLGRKAAADQ
jgi:nitrite reductase (cytochrome c-552)